ncbi:MAG: phosphodiester glycosidase family protein [Clostridium sp.]|uniref:phosphodiester glycosidase family protein n=1 Tax=Clostridium sp. TaxID=1506 RepID=UPI003D6D440F
MKFIRVGNEKKKKRLISLLMSFGLVWNICIFSAANAYATTQKDDLIIMEEKIANGVHYIEQKINYYDKDKNDIQLKQTLNIIKADLNNPDVGLIFSKAKDVVLAKDTVSKQIGQEKSKNNSVVGGINGDFFNMIIGASVGPQIKDGKPLVGYTCKSDESRYPIFGIDKNNKVFIENMSFNGRLALDEPGLNNIEQQSVLIDSFNRFDEFQVNKYSAKNSLMLLTPDYSLERKIKQSDYAPSEVFTIIRGIQGPILLDKQFTGVIESIEVGSKEVTIPRDGIVIASNGTKANWVKDNLKIGNKVKFNLGFSKKDIVSAMGGYNYLVKDGKTISEETMVSDVVDKYLVTSRKARTAIGITEDNKVVALTVGGGGASSTFSDGATLPEMASLMLQLGVTTALNFDGGGSAQMNVQHYADNTSTIVNTPSDYSERAVTNAILFTNKAPVTNTTSDISLKENILIYINSAYNFSIKGVDTNLHPMNFLDKKVIWSTQGKVGQVTSKGEFLAGSKSSIGEVKASLDGITGSTKVTVVDSLASLSITDKDTILLNPGDTYQFSVKATNEKGENVLIDNKAAKWSVTGNALEIDKNGLLKVKAKAKEVIGDVIVEAGGKKASVKIEGAKSIVLIEDFEHNDEAMYRVGGFVGGTSKISSEKSSNGNKSYKISYNYDEKWARKYNGTIDFIPTGVNSKGEDITSRYISKTRPVKIGMQVYGNGIAPWLRASIIDGNGKETIVDFAKSVNWKDEWKNVYAEIPENLPLPITLKKIYMVETDKTLHYKGNIYFDYIRFMYVDKEKSVGTVNN